MQAEEQRRAIDGPLVDFVPQAWAVFGHKFTPPHQLAPLLNALERAYRGEYVRFGFSVPPQHTKTSTLVAAAAQQIIRDPRTQIGYASFTASQAQKQSQRILSIAEYFGVEINTGNRGRGDWRTTLFGGVKAAGIDHGFTGNPFDIVFLDDPYDGRADAESLPHRQKVEDFINDTLEVRCRAIFLVHTRWHQDDALGRRSKDPNWEVVNLPAICEEYGDPFDAVLERDVHGRALRRDRVRATNRRVGDALWPEKKPVEFFANDMRDAFKWASLFQGRPRPREGALFGLATRYTTRPDALRIAVGVDLAYSEKTQSDWSTAVVLGKVADKVQIVGGKRSILERGPVYVLGVLRKQLKSTAFVAQLNVFLQPWPSAPLFAYLYGPEIGSADHMRHAGLLIRVLKKPGDKYTRALDCAAAWDDGLVRVPFDAPWVADFLEEVTSFTGEGSAKKDQVDALVAGFDALNMPTSELAVFGQRQGGEDIDVFSGGRRAPERPGEGTFSVPYDDAFRNSRTW